MNQQLTLQVKFLREELNRGIGGGRGEGRGPPSPSGSVLPARWIGTRCGALAACCATHSAHATLHAWCSQAMRLRAMPPATLRQALRCLGHAAPGRAHRPCANAPPPPRKTRGARANRVGEYPRKSLWVPPTLHGAGNRRSGNSKSLYKNTAIRHSPPPQC